ncbi:MAG: BolA family transcriptional regulator [Alphaproteobacteria bacterium]|nr:BolA family transcriptional regulator [Alphaproteobacteria bacterium]
MPVPASQIEAAIKAALPDAEIDLVDLVGDQDHYSATVTSAAFAGKSRIQQHRLVNAALKETLGGYLHALQLKTLAK